MCGGAKGNVGPTYEQQVSADINQQMWDYYQSEYKPLLEKFKSKVNDTGETEMEKRKVSGQINADVMKAATPASPSNAVMNQKKMIGLSDVKSTATAKAEEGVDVENVGKKTNLVNIGRKQATRAMMGLEDLASQSIGPALKYAEAKQNEAATLANNIGSLVGGVAGAAAGGMSAAKGTSRTSKGALIYGSPEYNKLATKWG
jgi:hypothetical protein